MEPVRFGAIKQITLLKRPKNSNARNDGSQPSSFL